MVDNKEVYVVDVEKGKKEIEVKYSKARSRFIGRSPLFGANNILLDQLSVEVTNFKEYINLVEDEQDFIKTCNQICRQLKEEFELKLVKSVENIINIMNGAFEEKLREMGVNDRSSIIIAVRKVTGKHNHLRNVHNLQQSYLDLISSQINEDSKFHDMDKLLTKQVLIEKISDDSNILS